MVGVMTTSIRAQEFRLADARREPLASLPAHVIARKREVTNSSSD
jgi:hypothetical protein